MNPTLTQKLTVEFIGTFFLVLTIGLAVKYAGDLAPIAIGGALTVMVFAGGHISGGHFNPAVSLAFFIRKELNLLETGAYCLTQIAAAMAAAAVVLGLGAAGEPVELGVPAAFAAEFLFTFALVWVILNVAVSGRTDGNSYYGLAIGIVVMAGAYSVGSLSGAAFNPAVAIGAVIAGLFDISTVWIYLVACPAGAAVAAVAFGFTSPELEPVE